MGIAGKCVLTQDEIGIREHLVIFVSDLIPVVRSDKTEHFVIAVNLTTLKNRPGKKSRQDTTTILKLGDHPFIIRDSIISKYTRFEVRDFYSKYCI